MSALDQLRSGRAGTGRIIDSLRKQFGGVWTFEHPCYWNNAAGWSVTAYSRCNIDPGGGESYSTEYRRSDTGRVVFP